MMTRHVRSVAILATAFALAAWDALASDPAISGGSGSSHKTAIVIHASSAADGVHAHDTYLRAHYPGYRFIRRAFAFYQGKSYEIITVIDAHGKKHGLYFDISEYFKPK